MFGNAEQSQILLLSYHTTQHGCPIIYSDQILSLAFLTNTRQTPSQDFKTHNGKNLHFTTIFAPSLDANHYLWALATQTHIHSTSPTILSTAMNVIVDRRIAWLKYLDYRIKVAIVSMPFHCCHLTLPMLCRLIAKRQTYIHMLLRSQRQDSKERPRIPAVSSPGLQQNGKRWL
jgi:hypothetical protein